MPHGQALARAGAAGRLRAPCRAPTNTHDLPKREIDWQLSRQDVPLRGNALWRMLYETAARASEILALDVEQLDLATAERPSAPGAAAASIAARPLSSSAWITSSESSVARCAALAGWCSLAIRCTVFQELLVLALSTGRCQITVGSTLTACDGWLTTALAILDDL